MGDESSEYMVPDVTEVPITDLASGSVEDVLVNVDHLKEAAKARHNIAGFAGKVAGVFLATEAAAITTIISTAGSVPYGETTASVVGAGLAAGLAMLFGGAAYSFHNEGREIGGKVTALNTALATRVMNQQGK